MNAEAFTHDVFLSHSAKDKAVVCAVAERLRKDGLKVWFDEWVLRVAASRQSAAFSSESQGTAEKDGGALPRRRYAEMIEEGLEHSRVLALCMSANAFGSDWAQLEAGTCGRGNLPFRDPLNKERRFIPLRLDDAPIKGSLAQFLYINWFQADREQEYAKLRQVCEAIGGNSVRFGEQRCFVRASKRRGKRKRNSSPCLTEVRHNVQVAWAGLILQN